MKTNFKYVFFMVAALLLGFSSCSNDEAVDAQPVEGLKTIVKISLTQNLATTYGPGIDVAPEGTEGVINSAVLYVFNAIKVLEKEVALDVPGTSVTTADKVFELTTGTKYFYAAVNVPSGLKPTIPVGTSMDVAIKSLLTVANVSELYPAATGYFMTSVNTAAAENIVEATEAEATAGTYNNIRIPVGRAMIKASVDYTYANVTQPASGNLTEVQFLLANNPKSMRYMAYLNAANQLETPFFNTYPVVPADYYPTLGNTASGLTFTSANGTATTYGMENSNSIPREGSATFALIQGKFTPAAVVDKDGAPAALDGFGNFWCIRHNGSLTGKFYREDPASGTDFAALTGTKETVAYAGGTCYYAFYLIDDSVTGNVVLKYTVKRNSFWKMAITSVGGVGSNTPGGVITDPDTPVEASTYIKGTINVLEWSVYNQSGGI